MVWANLVLSSGAASHGGTIERIGQIQWKYPDPTRRLRSNVVSATCGAHPISKLQLGDVETTPRQILRTGGTLSLLYPLNVGRGLHSVRSRTSGSPAFLAHLIV